MHSVDVRLDPIILLLLLTSAALARPSEQRQWQGVDSGSGLY